MLAKNDTQTVSLLAETYHQAALSNVDMRTVTDTLENLREALSGKRDIFEAWSLLDALVGNSKTASFEQALIKLREHYCQAIIAGEIEQLSADFQRDSAAGWAAWLKSYVAALIKFRISFCLALSSAPFTFPPDTEYAEETQRLTQLMLHARWAEVYDWVIFLINQNVPQEHKANLHVIAGEIQLYYLLERGRDKEQFEQAGKLAPKEMRVLCGLSEYWLKQNKINEARDLARRAIDVAPEEADGYLQLGDCYKQAGDLDAAEEQYQKAILANAGESQCYRRMMELYGSPEWFDARKDRIPELIKRIVTVEPDEAYSTLLTEGSIYEQNKMYQDAYRCYSQAQEMDSARVDAYSYYGHACLNESSRPERDTSRDEERLRDAQANFEKAIDVAPEALDGYWGMAVLCHQQERWEEALSWYSQSLEHRPQWEGIIRTRMGNIYRRLSKLPEAEKELTRALELEPDNQQVVDALTSLGDYYYKTDNDDEAALRVYEKIRHLPEMSDDYENLVGNMRYYQQEYQAAADAYRRAIKIDNSEAVYYSNLALALERQHVPGTRFEELNEAVDALRQAMKISPDDEEYGTRLKELERQLRFLERYGESALKLVPSVTPIRVEICSGLFQYILNPSMDNLSEDMFQRIDNMRQRVHSRFGLTIPGLRFITLEDTTADPGLYQFSLMERDVCSGIIPLGKQFSPAEPGDLAELGIEGTKPIPETAMEGRWVSEPNWQKAQEGGLELWPVGEYLLQHLQAVLELNLASFINHQEAINLLTTSDSKACQEIRDSHEKLTAFTSVLRKMLTKGAYIAAIDVISKEFIRLYSTGTSITEIMEYLVSIPELNKR
jgi:tetratricopeptide (TPR) repeat protein